MYRFLLRPRWILSHLFVTVVVLAMLTAGFWQLRRLDERRATNEKILSVTTDAPVPIDTLVTPTTPKSDLSALQYRPVSVTGTYRADEQVLINNRTNNGAPGYWVVTPLVQANGVAVAVNRGWVPYSVSVDGPWDEFAPPTGTVTVTGIIRLTQERSSGIVSGPADSATGELRLLSRVDVQRLAQQIDEKLLPVYINLTGTSVPVAPYPIAVPPPDLSEGPHLGYALQWFAFSLLTIIVYPLLLRRVAKRRQASLHDDDDDDGDDDLDGDEIEFVTTKES